ncbi:MAG TPA: sigma 54-interacting transcriptional regulator [Polyangiaceae bacterium]|jgi:DNA-binding NtrC family response regulator
MHEETLDGTQEGVSPLQGERGLAAQAKPGLLAIFAGSSAAWAPLSLEDGSSLTIGRASIPGDPRLSRAHAEFSLTADGWSIRDLGSRNGTYVDGRAVQGVVHVRCPRVIRLADTILVPSLDLRALEHPRSNKGLIIGTLLGRALQSVARAAGYSRTLVLHGESGTGKELAAREFHERGPHASGPFIAVNCATIPEGLAERLLFGTKRGAYSGADTDAIGHLSAADGGVLFLDEVAELDLSAQAKLLRVLETGEVVPLGAQRPHKVDVRVCVATHRKLREEAAAGRFREDLYYRLAPPEAVLPALRERTDEIMAHIADELAASKHDIAPHPALVEACLLRPWPGNVRELRKEIRQAIVSAVASKSDRVRVGHLSAAAGLELAPPPSTVSPPAPAQANGMREVMTDDAELGDGEGAQRKRSYIRWSASLTREQIERALADNRGNVAGAARTLGMNRSQLYREMARWSVGTGGSGAGSA